MAESTWLEVELPILEAIRAAEKDQLPPEYSLIQIQSSLGIPGEDLHIALLDLKDAGFIGSLDVRGGWRFGKPPLVNGVGRLTEKGRIAIKQWPGGDLAEALLAVLNRRIEDEGDPAIKTRLAGARDAISSVGLSVFSGLLTQAIQTGHLPHP